MAEKKMSISEKLAMIDKMSEKINEKYKKTVCGRVGNNEKLKEQLSLTFIPLPSPTLNEAIGGGIPRKRVTIISGVEAAGKTGTLLETIAKNQKDNPEFCALWLESEDSLDMNFMEMLGIDFDRLVIVMHDKDRGAEVALDELLAIVEAGKDIFDLVVINSLKALVPKTELENSLTKDTMALQARMNSKLMRKLGPTIANTNGALVLVNHLTTAFVMHGEPLQQSGGRAIRYWATMILDFRKNSIQETDPIGRDEGMKVACHVRKNRCVYDRNPYVKSEFFIVYGEGTEQVLETLQVCIDKEIINKAGAWLREIDPATGDPKVLADGTVLKWQGKAAFKEYCLANPEYLKDLQYRCGGGNYESLSEEEIKALENEATEDEEHYKEMSKLEEAIKEQDKKEKKDK